MRKRSLAAMLAIGAATPAIAQDYRSTIPDNADVAVRKSEDFDPIGGRIGSFFLYPTLTVTGTATDNVLARDQDKQADEYLTVHPAFRLTGGDTDRYANISAYVTSNFHAQLQRENTTQYGTAGYLRLGDSGSNRLELNYSAEALAESREDISNNVLARSPIKRDRYEADLAYTQMLNRISVLIAGTFLRSDFHDPITYSGAVLDLGFRNYNSFGGRTEVRYDLVNGFRLVGRGSYTSIRYDLRPGSRDFNPLVDFDRDSYVIRGEAGVGASIEDKLYGEVLIGYADSHAKQRRSVEPSNGGFSYNVDVVWNLNPITTLRLEGARTYAQTNSQFLRGYRYTTASIGADLALTPALLLQLSARFNHVEPLGPTSTRNEYGGQAQLTYRLNRRYAVIGSYRHSGRAANEGQQPFEANYGSVGFNVSL